MTKSRGIMPGDNYGDAKIYNLTTTIQSIERLLTRTTEDGNLLQVKLKLLETAIAAGRNEILMIEGELAILKDNIGATRASALGKMIESVNEFDNLLDMLSNSLHRLENEAP